MKLSTFNSSAFRATIFSCALLSLSLFSSAIPSYAQEKEPVKIKTKTFAYEITKETTPTDLDHIQKEINAEKLAKLHFSDIKRNEKKEIIGMTTQFTDERGSSQKKTEYNSQGIRPFSVKIHENAKGEKYLEIGDSNMPFGSAEDPFKPYEAASLQFKPERMQDMMKAMQESMNQQQELIMKLFEEAEKQHTDQNQHKK